MTTPENEIPDDQEALFYNYLIDTRLLRRMTKRVMVEPCTVAIDTPASEAIAHMLERRNRCILVLAEDVLVGLVTDRDIVRRVNEGRCELSKIPISQLMTPAPPTVFEEDTFGYVLGIMNLNNILHVPVLNEDHKLVGIVNMADILAFFMDRIFDNIVRLPPRPRAVVDGESASTP